MAADAAPDLSRPAARNLTVREAVGLLTGLTDAELTQLGGLLDVTGGALPLIREGEGCIDCRHTGYKGRQGIFEMFEVNEAVRELIMRRASVDEIRRQARSDGMLSLREAAVQKLLAGETSVGEVLKVTAVD